MQSIKELTQAIETLETRNAFQDDVIEQLNHELSIHQGQIAELKQQIALLATRIKESTPNEQQSKEEVEPPPPHY
ncbi:SlyX protein [Colwellia chukchiensis]|uniref:Protein SlyX homolog n=1 Tax=Colwellia chukchiensis TaxID=641665 RepID=A0A1H7R943_9GAMM|nr:SlyX family protein [Colwellia chukchiensis]SEL56761.1 SlyX protein [Colwellia chukchiensis]